MEKPTILKYLYYHCTKRKNPNCKQGSIEVKELEKQIDEHLSKIHISERFKNWAIKYLKEENEKELSLKEKILNSQQKAYDNCLKKLDNLFQLKISPLNTNESLLSDEEYARQKAELMKEKARLEEILSDTEGKIEKWLDIGKKVFNFACYARHWFANGTPEEKGSILQALGSNLTLKDKKLSILIRKVFIPIEDVSQSVPEIKPLFKPKKYGLNEHKLEEFYSKNPILLRGLDEVRTRIMSNLQDFYVPTFQKLK